MPRWGMLLCVLALPATAAADWHEAVSEHFVVYADIAAERVRKLADDLERFDQAVRVLRQLPDEPVGKANRVNVYVLDTVADVRELTGVAGSYRSRASGSVAFVPRRVGAGAAVINWRVILFHEYAHHMMCSNYSTAAFPVWLVEGWAEYHATATISDDGSVVFGAVPGYRAKALLAGNPPPLDRILAADTAKLTRAQRDALYGRGWALTHYLTNEPARKAQFREYLRAINQGRTPAEAAQIFGDLDVLHREVQRYIKGSTIPGVRVPAESISTGVVSVRKLTAGEGKTMEARIKSKRGVNDETAPRVFAEAKKAAASFPDDAGAQIVLAEAAYDARDYAGAEAAADRALAADPNAVDALTYKAMSRMAVAKAAGDTRTETWSGIRKIIAAANRLDPDDPEPLILYFQSFVQADLPPADLAKQGLERSLVLAPQDRDLRMSVARLRLADGDADAARALLAPLAYDPHGDAMSEQAAEMIATIDRKLAEDPAAGDLTGVAEGATKVE
jgi:tetratricopeptide (TPR) repeat protein